MSSPRAALHVLLDQIPDASLAKVREVLATLADNDQVTTAEEAAIAAGVASAEAGHVISADEVYAELDEMLDARRSPRRGA